MTYAESVLEIMARFRNVVKNHNECVKVMREAANVSDEDIQAIRDCNPYEGDCNEIL